MGKALIGAGEVLSALAVKRQQAIDDQARYGVLADATRTKGLLGRLFGSRPDPKHAASETKKQLDGLSTRYASVPGVSPQAQQEVSRTVADVQQTVRVDAEKHEVTDHFAKAKEALTSNIDPRLSTMFRSTGR